MPRERTQTVDRVQVGVARVELVLGGVVDVEQNRIPRALRVGAHHGEEVGLDERGARVVNKRSGCRQQFALMPPDHRIQGFNHVEPGHACIGERGDRRVAEPEPADDHVERIPLRSREPQMRELLLCDDEQRRHEVLLTELDFINLRSCCGLKTPPQHEVAHRRCDVVELFEAGDHEVWLTS